MYTLYSDQYSFRRDKHADPFIYNDKLDGQAFVKINYSIPRDELIKVKTFGDLVKKKRLEKGLYQKDLASILGVTNDTVTNWEFRGRMPRKRQREKLFEFLEINDSDLPTV